MWDDTPMVEAIFATATPQLQAADPAGARRYISLRLLRDGLRRPCLWEEFVAQRPDKIQALPLVYDRPSRLVHVGGHADHERIIAELYHFRQLRPVAAVSWEAVWREAVDYSRHDWADRYIEEGMGFLQGSPSAGLGKRVLNIGQNVKLSPAERAVFQEYELRRA